jgi:hypothetical protein
MRESTAKKQHGDQSSRLLLYEGHQSCRVLAVEGGLGRSISGMQIAPCAGVVPPEPETSLAGCSFTSATDEPPYETPQ